MKQVLYPFQSVLFIILVICLALGFAVDMVISATLICLCYVFRMWSWVMWLGVHLSDSLETLNEMVFSLSDEANEILSKKQN